MLKKRNEQLTENKRINELKEKIERAEKRMNQIKDINDCKR